MLTEKEKREMREMGESASLREEFRTLRRNSRAIEERIGLDQVVRWLTAMTRISSAAAKRRPFTDYANVKI